MPAKRVSIVWTPSGEQKMIRVIEVGRERFGERNHRRAGKNGAAAEKGVSQINTPGKSRKDNMGLDRLLCYMTGEPGMGSRPELHAPPSTKGNVTCKLSPVYSLPG